MRGRGLNVKTKSWRKGIAGNYSNFGRKMDEYQQIPEELFQDIVHHYEKDFEVYGYGFKRINGSVVTECAAAENNGDKCC